MGQDNANIAACDRIEATLMGVRCACVIGAAAPPVSSSVFLECCAPVPLHVGDEEAEGAQHVEPQSFL